MDTDVRDVETTSSHTDAEVVPGLASASAAGTAAVVALLVVPVAAWLSVSGPDVAGVARWPLMLLGVAGWVVASRRWGGVERALPSIVALYVLFSLTFLFEPSA